jgi:ABC-type multidrug transport system fused ATPase/permease subunit
LDVLLSRVKIATDYAAFNVTFPSSTGDTLQFITYFGLVCAAFPAFFSIYPTQERIRNVRAMEYSNGVRPLPLWAAYTLFDWLNTVIAFVLVTIILSVATSSAWYHIGYIFLVLILYGLAAVLLSYLISRIAKSHFSAFAFAAGGQAVMFLVFLTTYWSIESRSNPADVNHQLVIAYYVIGVISPITQLLKALMVGLNIFSILCIGSPPVKATNAAAMGLYGGPILFLILQSLIMFAVLVWSDHNFSLGRFKKSKAKAVDLEKTIVAEGDVAEEEARVAQSNDGLRILHVDKVFKQFLGGKVHAVENLTFGVKQGEVFALVGPNGGKS